MYSVENTINRIISTLYGATKDNNQINLNKYQTHFTDHFIKYINTESLCCIPETNKIY